ncbi:MAG: cell division protein FtsA, partial [Alphaproteobacteria bacterium]|nr:cell division protein FtsA [Alphaproteobacteria bacterium]
MAGGKGTVVAALDVGSSKVSCFIARLSESGGVRVEGIGHQLSEGVRAGAIVDMEKAANSIRAAIDQAERMAGATIRHVLVNLSAGMPESEAVHVEVKIAGHQVGEADIRRALAEGRRQAETYDREVVHAIPVTYSIDGSRGIRDPRGMHGNLLGVDIHVVTAAAGPLHNLRLCLGQGHLGIAGIVVSSYASGLSTLVEDERDMGATLIDMGGGTTSIGVYMEGDLVFSDVIPLGGNHITQDIARGLLTPMKHAERLKTLHGSALRSASDDRESISVVHVGENGKQSQIMPRAMLSGVIQPRVEEIFEAVRDRLISTGFDR